VELVLQHEGVLRVLQNVHYCYRFQKGKARIKRRRPQWRCYQSLNKFSQLRYEQL
jgi:hypothetical protein